MARPCLRPDNRGQFQHHPPRFRWPRPAALEQIVRFNAVLFEQLEPMIGAPRAVEMIICAVTGVRW